MNPCPHCGFVFSAWKHWWVEWGSQSGRTKLGVRVRGSWCSECSSSGRALRMPLSSGCPFSGLTGACLGGGGDVLTPSGGGF